MMMMNTELRARVAAQRVTERTGVIVYVEDDRERRAVTFRIKDADGRLRIVAGVTDEFYTNGHDADHYIENEVLAGVRAAVPQKAW